MDYAVDFNHLPLSHIWHLLVRQGIVKTRAPHCVSIFFFINSAREHAIDYLANVRHRVSFPSSRDIGHGELIGVHLLKMCAHDGWFSLVHIIWWHIIGGVISYGIIVCKQS